MMSICNLSPPEIDDMGWLDFVITIGFVDTVIDVRNKVGGW